jgi:hypothetical protein
MPGRFYAIYSFDLTNAGEEVVEGPWSIVRVLDAVDGAGIVVPSTKITARAERENEAAPMRLGQAFLARDTSRWIIAWEAQSGVTVTLGFASEPGRVDWDADPATQLLATAVNIAGNPAFDSIDDVTLTASSTTEILGSDNARREAIISNPIGNTQTFRIGDSGAGATNGILLPPGGTIILATTAEIHGYNPGGGDEDVAVAELKAS